MVSTRNRDIAMNAVAPVWDGNETWLVLGGGGLLAVFPLAYAILLPALYIPVILMLLGLVLRGVAFEFRWKTRAREISLGLGILWWLARSPRSRKASCSERSCKAYRFRDGPSRVDHSIG